MTVPVNGRQTAGRPGGLGLWHFLLLGALVAIDQLSKWQVQLHLPLGHSQPVLGPVMSLTHSHNYGAAMGLLPLAGPVLAATAALLVVALIIWGTRHASPSPLLSAGLTLLLAGALGNLADRLRLGYVVDFLDFHFWPVFNVADIAVVIGAALLLIDVLRATRPASEDPES